jgi:hypothetical protein
MEWISLSEKKPPQNTPVLVAKYDHRENVKMHFISLGYRIGTQWFYAGNTGEDESLNDKYGFVTHWMILPDPPTEANLPIMESQRLRK